MKTITLTIELKYDSEIMYESNDEEAKEWFVEDVLGGPLSLYSHEVGDVIGVVKVVKIDSEL